MPDKNNSKHVEGFALQPICGGPNARDARDLFAICGTCFDTQAFVLRKGIKVEYHVETFLALRPIHSGQIGKQVKLFFIAQILSNFRQLPAFHRENCLLAIFNCFHEG